MGKFGTNQWRKRLLASLATAVMALTITPSVFAQAGADAAQARSVDIPAGPLGDVLLEISTLYGVNIIASELVVTGKSAPSIAGSLAPEDALALALEGSGLEAKPESAGGYVIVSIKTPTSTPTAREPEPEPVRAVEVIVVTGTKQNRSIQETTSSVDIFDIGRMDNEALFTLNDVLSRSANTSVVGNNINDISIRGINRNGTDGAGQGQAINVFVDGAPVSAAGLEGINTLWDTQQVEVLRGSQSAVQGRNAIAGAVIVQSKQPSYQWEGAARARFAEFGARQYAGVLSGPIIENQLAFRLSADLQESDGSITDGFSGEDDNFQDTLTIRGRALFEPSAIYNLSALFTLEYSDREIGRVTPVVFSPNPLLDVGDVAVDPDLFENFDPDNRVTFPLIPVFRDNESIKAIADITYDFSDSVSLKFLGTYEDTQSIVRDVRREASRFGDVGLVADGDNVTYTAEARLHFDFDKLSGLVGGYYFDFENERVVVATNLIAASLPFPVRPIDSVLVGDQVGTEDVENYAFFTSWRFEPNEKWDLDFGLRYDREEFSTILVPGSIEIFPEDCETDVPGFFVDSPDDPIVTVPCTFAAELFVPKPQPLQSDSFDVLLPNGAVTYDFNSDFSVFASVRRGYRAGGTFLAGSLSTAEPFQVVTFGPEFLMSYEAGWRGQWLNKKLIVNGTAFFSDYDDQQVKFIDAEGFNNVLNAGDTSIYGLELSADYQATDEWNIYGSLGLLESDINQLLFEADDPDTPGDQSIDLAGNELERSPSVSFTLGTSYEHDSGLFGSVSVSYQSSYESDIFNLGPEDLLNGLTERTEASTLVNARLGYAFGNFTLTAFGTNLLDDNDPETIQLAGADALQTPGSLSNVSSFTLRQPRSFGISVDASF